MRTLIFTVFKPILIVLLMVSGGIWPAVTQPQTELILQPESTSKWTALSSALSSAPVEFIENAGQFGNGELFQVRWGDRTIWLAENAVWITLLTKPGKGTEGQGNEELSATLIQNQNSENENRNGVNLKLSFPGANPHPRIEPFNRLDTHVSYFLGNDPAKWRADVPVWGGLCYKDLYPGIDLEATSEDGRMVLRLVASEGADLDAVGLRVEGVDGMVLDGDLLRLTTAVGKYTLPLLQVSGASSVKLPLPTITGNQVTSPFGNPQGKATTVSAQSSASDLLYATFLGGSSSDEGHGIAIDSSGAAYVTGQTYSSDFPTTPGALDTSYNGSLDAFVVKLNAAGSALTYSTFLGGSGGDDGEGIAIDSSGAAYVTGFTNSSNFPTTPGAFDTSFNGSTYTGDAFVMKLNAAGSALDYSTFLGGSAFDDGEGIAIDSSGAAYVTGITDSFNFPTTLGAFDTSYGGNSDAFVVKLNAAGSALTYATFLGGSDFYEDEGWGIAIDSSGAAYVMGNTKSSDFPTTPGAFDTSFNGGTYYYGGDTFVVKLNAAGSALVYSTFLGGSGDDWGKGIAIDSSSGACVTGNTSSPDFPTIPGAFDTSFNGGSYDGDAFVVKLNAAGSALVYSTFLGGSSVDRGKGIAIDSSGTAYVTGLAYSSDFPTTPGAFDTSFNGGGDTFVVKLNTAGTSLDYSTFLGGSGNDDGYGIAIDSGGAAYVTGYAGSPNFPTAPGAFDTSFSGGTQDGFVVKLAMVNAIINKLYLPLVIR